MCLTDLTNYSVFARRAHANETTLLFLRAAHFPISIANITHMAAYPVHMVCQVCKDLVRQPLNVGCCTVCAACCCLALGPDSFQRNGASIEWLQCPCEKPERCEADNVNRRLVTEIDRTYPSLPCKHKDALDCGFQGPPSSHVDHVCSNQKCVACGAVVPGSDMEAHTRDSCPKRTVHCGFCKTKTTADELATHWGREPPTTDEDVLRGCKEGSLTCTCTQVVAKSDADKHRDTCSHGVVTCQYCESSVARGQLADHQDEHVRCLRLQRAQLTSQVAKLKAVPLVSELGKTPLERIRAVIHMQGAMGLNSEGDPYLFTKKPLKKRNGVSTNIPSSASLQVGERVLVLKFTDFHAGTIMLTPDETNGLYSVHIDGFSIKIDDRMKAEHLVSLRFANHGLTAQEVAAVEAASDV